MQMFPATSASSQAGSLPTSGTISGGTITGQVNNLDFGAITGGDFTGATVADFGAPSPAACSKILASRTAC